MTSTASAEKFIGSWADMACKWSVNHTVAQAHALSYLSERPLSAEDVSSALSVSRSIASASLRALESLGLVRPVHIRGDRKQYYEAKNCACEAFRVILDDYKRRVIDPAVDQFHKCLEEQERTAPEDSYTLERMREVVSFFDDAILLYEQLRCLPAGSVENFLRVTSAARQILG